MKKTTTFISDRFEIEGRLTEGDQQKAVVITHPHPLYGGDMHNNVVDTVSYAYQKNGYTTLRFNFRGVGGSQGSYSDGIGEQEDVRAAVREVTVTASASRRMSVLLSHISPISAPGRSILPATHSGPG